MNIRTAVLDDLSAIAEIGALCYPAEEALTKEEYRERLRLNLQGGTDRLLQNRRT